MVRQVFVFLFILISTNICFGQEGALDRDKPASQWAEHALNQLPEQIKTVNEPALRIFLKLRLATFLWSTGPQTRFLSPKKAEAIVIDALADLKGHEDEMPSLYAKLFRADLLALVHLHAPDLAKRLVEQYGVKQDDNRKPLDVAYSMLNEKDGIAPAVEIVRRSLRSGQSPEPGILFFLSKLQNDRPAELPRLLSAILGLEDQTPGSISVETLFWLNTMYLREENPSELRLRFAVMVISIVEKTEDWSDGGRAAQAYQLVSNTLPIIEKLAPSLYRQCHNLLSALWARLPQSVADRMTIESRIRQSSDKLNQLIIEANVVKDEALKDDLLTEAAQLALGKKELKKAADLAASTSSEGNHGLWRDQFLGDILEQALKEKDLTLAEYVVTKINLVFNRALSLQKIALYFYESKDLARAREMLNEAAKLAASEENHVQKARLLFGIAISFTKVDEIRVTEMIQAAIKVINQIPQPDLDEKPDSNARKDYLQSLTHVAWNIVPVFRGISVKDYIGAYSVADGIHNRGIRLAAIFGAATGILQTNKSLDSKAQKN